MEDLILVFQYLFSWKFFLILAAILVLGLRLPDSAIKPFRSVRFNIWLFLAIALSSAAGTFFPQIDLYHSWWFAGLLALMAFDVIVCKLRTLPKLVHAVSKGKLAGEDPKTLLGRTTFKAEMESNQSFTETVELIRRWLEKKKFRFSEFTVPADSRPASVAVFSAARHSVQRWGDFILHVSIVAVLAGNLMGAMFGFEEILPIEEGGSIRMRNRPYEIVLNNFDIEYYRSTGAPSLYASDLTVQQDGTAIARKRIVVNDPLDIDRVRFYQASWGMTTKFRSARMLLGSKEFVLKPHEVTEVPGTPLAVRANLFLPSFTINPEGQPTTADYQGRNPALQVDFLEAGKLRVSLWILQARPELAFRIEETGVSRTSPPPFRLLEVEPVLFSGIQVGYDPGAPLFWFGSIWLLVGLCMHFYLHQRRFRIVVVKKGERAGVTVGGWNSRTKEDFQKEFSDWTSELRRIVS